jgi:peptidoglycan/xylan/chitin deacetylase (PgdA/CDA1 family)
MRLPTLLKRGLRSTADRAARMSGFLARRERGRTRHLTVLTYHRVLPESRCAEYPFPSLVMPLGAFRAQVRWLAQQGDVLPLGLALERHGQDARRPVFALTFDDGYHDSKDFIAEVLEEAGVRGTFFVTTGFVGSDELLWFDRAVLLFAAVGERVRRDVVRQVCGEGEAGESPREQADCATWTRHLKRFTPRDRAAVLSALEISAGGPPPTEGFRSMSVADVVDLRRRGHEIGSHTVSHAMLPDLDDPALRQEVEGARATLSSWLGSEVTGFCYPDGNHDDRTVAAVRRAGHAHACTTRDGVHVQGGDPYRIPRVDVAPQRVTNGSRQLDLTAFRRELCGLYRRRARSPVA